LDAGLECQGPGGCFVAQALQADKDSETGKQAGRGVTDEEASPTDVCRYAA